MKKIITISLLVSSILLFCNASNIIRYYGTHYVKGYSVSYGEEYESQPPYSASTPEYHADSDKDWFILKGIEWAIVLISVGLFVTSLKLSSKWNSTW